MRASKTKIFHTRAVGDPVEVERGDLTGEGIEVVIDKATHELVIPRGQESEETVTIVIRPTGGDGCTGE